MDGAPRYRVELLERQRSRTLDTERCSVGADPAGTIAGMVYWPHGSNWPIMPRKVLVPFDSSDPAMEALEVAIEEYGDGDIIALHVIDPSDSSHGLQGAAADDLYEQVREDAEERLAEANRRANQQDATVTIAIEEGTPAETIVEYAETNDIDHVVIGSHGRSGVSRILLGSVAESVVRESPVPVTVIR